MIAVSLLMMIPPPPPAVGPLRGNIDCLLEKSGVSYAAEIELDQGNAASQVVLRGLGLPTTASIATLDLESGNIIARSAKGEPQFQLASAKRGKWGNWWHYAAGSTQGVCYGQLFGEQTDRAHFSSVASVEVN